ncbi:MAG: glycoside hydrolase family 3 C-terminal domain-containing protein [bacterium]|nr:glycoside hydrolase family 3 C-terminal domain-containing protein [bacterium]
MKLIASVFCILFSSALLAQTDADHLIESKIDSILPLLTMEEKVAMCHAQSKFSSPGVERLGIPELWMSDGPHGVRAEINWDNWGYAGWTNDSITAFPALTCLASTFNESLSYEYGKAVGEEARYREKDVLLGPGVNIYRTPLNGRNFEYMGEDPFLASQLVVPYIKGVQENGVAACVKHYVLNNQEKWRDHINVKVSDRALHEIYLPAFKVAVEDGGVWSIMGAYNQYDGQHCCHNEVLLNKILKEDWKFDGVVVTDWGGAHDSKEAALYGLDIEMGTGTNGLSYSLKNAYENYYLAGPFKELLRNKEVPESVLDDKVRRILRLMYRTNLKSNKPLGSINTEAHQQTARKIAQEGIVLLKNENNFFPVKDENITIAVIGENSIRAMTKGGGSSELKPKYEISPLEGLKTRYKNANIVHALGYASGPPVYGRVVTPSVDTKSLQREAVEVAKSADIVLFFGGLNKNHHQDCEGGDRLEYGLPFGQVELLKEIAKVNDNIGFINISGNAIETPWLDDVKGFIQGWYIGSEAGNALADVISGDVNPSGKLPFSFPVKLSDNAAHSFGEISYPGDSIDQEYKEGILVGYRWHDTKKIKPQFAFGYGLSYTQFDLSQVKTDKSQYTEQDKIEVSFELKNTGLNNGSEVIQVYVGKPKSKVERAQKELKGYQKISVKSGTTENGNISIPVSSLKYYDESSQSWVLEKGSYLVYIGNSSDNIQAKLKVNIK